MILLQFNQKKEFNKQAWIDKIWQTRNISDHSNEAPITLLYWINLDSHPRHDEEIQFGDDSKVCGKCHFTVE